MVQIESKLKTDVGFENTNSFYVKSAESDKNEDKILEPHKAGRGGVNVVQIESKLKIDAGFENTNSILT